MDEVEGIFSSKCNECQSEIAMEFPSILYCSERCREKGGLRFACFAIEEERRKKEISKDYVPVAQRPEPGAL